MSEQSQNWKSKLRYFPCVSKQPRDKGWQQQATTEAAQIARWLSEPNVNLGIACGAESDVFVLDIDVKDDDGYETLRQLEEKHTPLPHTYTVRTPSGGTHKYFKHPQVKVPNKVKFAPGLDTRSDGGLVIAPGSHLGDKSYECVIDAEPATAPHWLLKEIVASESKQTSEPIPSQIPQGQRNDSLFRLGSSMRQKGFNSESIEAALLVENRKRCKPPLPDAEVRAAAAQAAKYEPSKAADADSWRQLFKNYAEEDEVPFNWLVKDLIEIESATALGGLSGHGKTLLAISLGKAIVLGRSFLNHFEVAQPYPVLYLIPEAGSRSFRKRLRSFQLTLADDRFLYRTLSHGATIPLSDPRVLKAVSGRVVFLDTAIRFSQGDENSSSENQKGLAQDIFSLLQAGAIAVILIHHSPKSSQNQDVMTLENVLRGSTDIGAMLSNVYGVRQLDSARNRIHVECVKARDIEPITPFEIEGRPYIDSEGDFRLIKKPGECGFLADEKPTRKSKEDEAKSRIREWRAQGTLGVNELIKKLQDAKLSSSKKETSKWIHDVENEGAAVQNEIEM